MLRKFLFIVLVSSFLAILPHTNSFAGSTIYTLNAGYLQEFDDSHYYWDPGIGVSVGAYYPVYSYILLGGHFSFNRWAPAESPLKECYVLAGGPVVQPGFMVFTLQSGWQLQRIGVIAS